MLALQVFLTVWLAWTVVNLLLYTVATARLQRLTASDVLAAMLHHTATLAWVAAGAAVLILSTHAGAHGASVAMERY